MLQTRYARTVSLLLIITILALSGCREHDSEQERPNIIFIFTDDHAIHALSAYDSGLIHTPHLDRLADEGMKFNQAFVTNSICAPSRAVLLTGTHSHINGQLTNAQTFDGTQLTYPQLLREAGYRTAMIGKWHLRSDPTGYDYWEVLPGQGDYYNPDFITEEGRHREEGYVTDIITDKVIDWIDSARGTGEPFMVNYHHKAPHRNWMPGPDHLRHFEGVEFPEPTSLYANWSGELPEQDMQDRAYAGQGERTSAVRSQEMSLLNHFSPAWDLKLPPDEMEGEQHYELWRNTYDRFNEQQKAEWDAVYDEVYRDYIGEGREGRELLGWTYQRYMNDYLATIASVDDNLGRLLDYLEESGLADNTVIIYTSDQGFFLGDDGWYDKRWMYEVSLQIPLLVRWPEKVDPGRVNSDLVQNIDFAPTLLELAGLDVPRQMQGRSLLPLLLDQLPDDWRESIYYHYYEYPGEHAVPRHYGVRTDRYKLIHYYQIGEWELFDLDEDPTEMRSVYNDPDYSDVTEELKQELERLREAYRVPETDPV